MSYKDSAQEIINLVGGQPNVENLNHCLTRLRFKLSDASKADQNALKSLKYVLGVVDNGNEFQVIIGTDVENYFRAIQDISSGPKSTQKKDLKSLGSAFVETISGIFNPIIPALTAAGMLQALLAVLKTFGILSVTSQAYQVLAFMGNTTFYFLPIMLASSSAKKFRTNQFVAIMLGAMLIHPDFIAMVSKSKETMEVIRFAGLPIYNAVYTSSVIPIILGVYAMSKIEPIADRISPKSIKFFSKPLLTILFTGLLTLIVLGPLGYIASTWITNGVKYLDSIAGWIVPTLIGMILPLMVMTGVHHGLTAVGINNRVTIGYDSMIYPGQLASNVAQGAAGFAVAIKAKNSQIKQMAAATSLTAMCGITEPILFGLTMRVKTNLVATIAGGGVAGFIFGILNVKNFSGGAPGLLTLPSYIGLNAPMSNFYFAIFGSAVGALVSFVLAYILYDDARYEEHPEPIKQNTTASEVLHAPVDGEAVALKNVNDPTFSEEMMGKGIAFIPTSNEILAPISGKIATIFPTKHAIILVSDNGSEIILHVGLDTVNLNGEHFTLFVKEGDTVTLGQPLMHVDFASIAKAGYDIITPMVILNSQQYGVVNAHTGVLTAGSPAIDLVK